MKYKLILLILTISSFGMHAQNQGLDASFGNGGMIFPDSSIFFYSDSSSSYYYRDSSGSFALQGDKILVGGNGGVRRYNSNGEEDNTFNATSVPAGGHMLIQPDNKILVLANLSLQSNQYSVLTRLNGDGTIDTAFGSNGNGMDSFFNSNFDISTVALLLLPDNKIILVANTDTVAMYMTRLLSNGLTDSSFGSNGIVMNNHINQSNEIRGAVLQSDGKIVVGANGAGCTAVRYLPSGERDITYGDAGFARYPFEHGVSAIGIQSDGKILLAGTDEGNLPGAPAFRLIRFDTAGNADTSFNHTGLGIYSWNNGSYESTTDNGCRALLVQPDGKIILGGRVENNTNNNVDFGLMRVLPDGELDSSFGEHGKLRTSIGNKLDDVFELALQPDGKILAAGASKQANGRRKGVLVRYLPQDNTGISEPSLNSTFILYPNPATDKVHLFSKGSPATVSITLTDIAGRIMLTRTCTLGAQEIGLSNLKAGIYILRITDRNDKTERFKIVKQ